MYGGIVTTRQVNRFLEIRTKTHIRKKYVNLSPLHKIERNPLIKQEVVLACSGLTTESLFISVSKYICVYIYFETEINKRSVPLYVCIYIYI